jgi:hypothetical protein
MKFKINDSYRSKSKLTEALFGAPGSTKGGDVDRFVPKMRAAHRSDGFYGFKLMGLLGKLDVRADPNYGGPPAEGGAGPETGGGGAGVVPDNPRRRVRVAPTEPTP